MFGSITGNIAGISYFLLFQIAGILVSLAVLRRERTGFALLMGSVTGSFALQWFPALYAFITGFTMGAHLLALISIIGLAAAACILSRKKSGPRHIRISGVYSLFMNDPVLFLLLPLFLYMVITLNHHTIPYVDGAMHSGQAVFGDMNMHLGFVTSIARQQTFPPEYSILPGTQLAYPFLSDSISSSLYLMGASLRTAYLFPMYFALLQVFFGMYCTAKYSLRQMGRTCRGKSMTAFALFFLNGGFGFYYFITKGFHSENFTRIFSAFYETPTNYTACNIQWHNVLCDMLIPQRATLFGWAVLFPVLALLVKAGQKKKQGYFIIAGIFSGGLVLIHTHSFLALGVLCAGFLARDLYDGYHPVERKRWPLAARAATVAAFLLSMSLIRMKQQSDAPLSAGAVLAAGIMIICCFVFFLLYHMRKGYSRKILLTWGFFLGIVLILALPQLIGFTFRQAQGSQFLRGSFNWANASDGYIWFYIKNLGITFILAILLLVHGTRKQLRLVLPACLLWLISEFILFQPNSYDNNKLLLIAYLFFCIGIADFIWDTIPSLVRESPRQMRFLTVTAVTALSTLAALLTMGREYVSDYELYSSSYVSLAEWIEENTKPSDTFLTATNHNNAVASLTGRSIVCGSGTFLYFHGTDYRQNETDTALIYEDPSRRDQLLKQYGVDYIVIGPNELGTYAIPDYDSMIAAYPVVYSGDEIVLLAVT